MICMSSMEGTDGLALDQLVAFDQVVRDGSFSRAALSLGLGQPAVSSRIQGLEAALGGPVFRRGRPIALTPLGENFLPYARRTMEVLSEGVENVRLTLAGKRGRASLGTLASLAGALVGPALGRLMRQHPEVDCLVRSGWHEAMLGLLLDGLVELALVTWPCPPALEPELRLLFTLREPVVLVAHRRHPLARLARVRAADVVRLGRPCYRLRWWQAHHPAIDRLAERTGRNLELPMESARQLVNAGQGVGFFPRTLIAEDITRGSLREIRVRDVAAITRDSALVRRLRGGPLSPASEQLAACLRAEASAQGLLRR
jgi:LysR family transcriptional regulator, low CO2-responsive transcriptional regulator